MAVHRLDPTLRTPHRKSMKSIAIVLNQTLKSIFKRDCAPEKRKLSSPYNGAKGRFTVTKL
jgi:hypothetical protein